jgi:predicted HicB family RNase H-like nuclease
MKRAYGKNQIAILHVRLNPELHLRIVKKAEGEAKTVSDMIREKIEELITA